MKRSAGHLLYIAAVSITALVIASKYFGVSVPTATAWVMRDPTQSLLLALLLTFVARWM